MDALVNEITEKIERKLAKSLAQMKREIVAEVTANMRGSESFGDAKRGGELVKVSDKQVMMAVTACLDQNYPVLIEPKIRKTIDRQVAPQIDTLTRKIRSIAYDPNEELDAYRHSFATKD